MDEETPMTSKTASQKIIVTGAAGFIGFHLSRALLEAGWEVIGVDNLSAYYDVRIKRKRLKLLADFPRFRFIKMDLKDRTKFPALVAAEQPREIVHLAAQAGVRYSLTDPWAYADANYLGTLAVFEAARHAGLKRVVYASSSSVYGANTKQPFSENDRVDTPLSLYAASKRANELLAHAYTNLFGIESAGLRFFTVYGTWSRPDMALFKFARAIAEGKPIDMYNRGEMKRSFTYVDDVVAGIMHALAEEPQGRYRIYNLGGSEAVPLTRFVELIEKELGMKAEKNLLPLQAGDVPETVADCTLAERELGYAPQVSIEEGVKRFVQWFRENEKFARSLEAAKQ
jgi:UDP-glucuronate 4-epimerase